MKKASVSIVLLVIMSLVLAGATLFIFYTHNGYVSSTIKDSRFLDSLYVKEGKIDFYIYDIMEKSISKINDKQNPIPEFTSNFKDELLKYKVNESYDMAELGQLENQISEDKVDFDGKNIIIKFSIILKDSYERKFSASYAYTKTFSREVS